MKSPFKYKRKLNKENNKEEQRTRDRGGRGDAQRSPLFCILKYFVSMTTCKRKKKTGHTHTYHEGKYREKKKTPSQMRFNSTVGSQWKVNPLSDEMTEHQPKKKKED